MEKVTVIIVLIIVFLVTVPFAEATSRLLVTSTADVSVTCSLSSSAMAIFSDEDVTFSDVQIIGRFGAHGDQEHVLATLTRAGAVQSYFLNASYPMSRVSGKVTGTGKNLEVWVTLTIAGCEYGQFTCVVSYVNKAANSNTPLKRRLDPVNYIPGNEAVKTNDVSVAVLPGLSLLCEHTAKDQAAAGLTDVIISSEKRDLILAAWSRDTPRCAEDVLCRPGSVVASYMSFRVHVLNSSRDDWGKFICTVYTQGEENPTTITEDVWPTACLNACLVAYIAIAALAAVAVALAIGCLVLVCKRKDSEEAADENATTDPAEDSKDTEDSKKTGDLKDTDDSKDSEDSDELQHVFITPPATPQKSSRARKRDRKKRRAKTAK